MRHRNMSKASGRDPKTGHGIGPSGRIERLRQLVTATVRHERIEGVRDYMDETRGYVERLIMLAIKNGDRHRPTMEMADYWLKEKDLVHKLFKVLAPRYRYYTSSFTDMHRLPTEYPGGGCPQAVLELKGNPWPAIRNKSRDSENTLLNVLMTAARKSYREDKYNELAKSLHTNTPLTGGSSETDSVDKELGTSGETSNESQENVKFSASFKRDTSNVPIEGTPV